MGDEDMRRKIRSKLLVLLDIFLINIAILISYLMRFDGDLKSMPP